MNSVANEVILYSGTNALDTNPAFLKQLLELLINSDSVDRLNILGKSNYIAMHMGKLVNHPKVNLVHGIGDDALGGNVLQEHPYDMSAGMRNFWVCSNRVNAMRYACFSFRLTTL